MARLSRLELLDMYGFETDPFKSMNYKTSDMSRIHRILGMAVKSRAMVSIVGERGLGKSRAVVDALNKHKVHQVIVQSADKDRLLISDIERALILDLSEEKPRRGNEIRARQLRRIVGEASMKHEVVLVIEEAHRLHGMTLRALKTLREMDWAGEKELFTVVLIGQSDPMGKAGLSEVRLRTDSVTMQGLTAEEVCGYIKASMGNIFDSAAVKAVGRLGKATNFLDLQDIILTLMARALANGRDKVSIEDVEEEYGSEQGEIPLRQADVHDIKEVKKVRINEK